MDTSKHRTNTQLDKLKGFKLYKRRNESYRNSSTRTKDWAEISHRLTKHELQYQTARCMDCGVPFCQSDTGCPISNIIPKWNELVFKDRWYDALQRLLMTNNFPEFTGRVCPAPCEGACVLGISEDPVGIKSVEAAIVDYGFDQGWIQPYVVEQRNSKSVAVIGSGPAGLASADQLNRAGYTVTIFEREDKFGGLLMYGIPNMKLDKRLVDRRVKLLESSGVNFVNNACIGVDVHLDNLKEDYDAVVVAIGSTIPRDLNIKGRSLNNIKYAMELLKWNTKALLTQELPEVRSYLENKRVIVIGGGDTGNDCLGTAVRHGAKSVVNFELMPKPPTTRARDNPWPQWPKIFRVDYGHNEVKAHYGRDPREFCVMSKEFIGDDEGNVTGIKTVRVEWKQSESGAWQMSEVPSSEEFFQADVVLLSMGFIGPEAQNFDLKCDSRGNFVANDVNYHLEDNVFAAGDCRRGQSLIVWAIQEGRQCARQVDIALGGASMLPASGSIVDISGTTEVAV